MVCGDGAASTCIEGVSIGLDKLLCSLFNCLAVLGRGLGAGSIGGWLSWSNLNFISSIKILGSLAKELGPVNIVIPL